MGNEMSAKTILCNHTGTQVEYEITSGFQLGAIIKMQADWQAEKSMVLKEIIAKYGVQLDDEDFAQEALLRYNLADLNWDWTAKAFHCKSDDYIWFLFMAEGHVQGACVVYHPKQSRFDGDNIFYIDYIAASYSNRDRPDYTRRFSGVGSRLISFVSKFALETLSYRHGFCLHSLPTAELYYRGLGMTEFPADPDKENLVYFEACPATAAKIAGAA
ncbi:hypothetical protein HX797_00535 [Pseudomonas edaphica]|uniref:GNAT family N-acetyltransferase n=1 Tax=Pseudomonas edaphica TaxID=2006980 RepID=A0A7Y7RM53_9PSED|nr:hypothetical protein [Pseudomonas edaphica]